VSVVFIIIFLCPPSASDMRLTSPSLLHPSVAHTMKLSLNQITTHCSVPSLSQFPPFLPSLPSRPSSLLLNCSQLQRRMGMQTKGERKEKKKKGNDRNEVHALNDVARKWLSEGVMLCMMSRGTSILRMPT
jgi:hypothetical protein